MGVDPAWRKSKIAALLTGQHSDGSFGPSHYSKWKGTHWRLVSLVELGVSKTNRAVRAAVEAELDWISNPRHTAPVIRGLERRHASIEGNALAVSCRLGFARNPKARYLVDVLLRAQWPDGGWNCDRDPKAHRSSFHESLAPIWGLFEYHAATGDAETRNAARRGAELVLEHHLFRSTRTGSVIHPEWVHIHWPHYWHYDYFHGLRAVAKLGLLGDGRCHDALDLLQQRRRSDGTWGASGRRYWRPATEVVDWGDAHQIVTPVAKALLDPKARTEPARAVHLDTKALIGK